MIEGLPLPVTDDRVDAGYWTAALHSRLVIQTCAVCRRRRFPPRLMCPHCQSDSFEWVEVSGRGTLWSFATPEPPLLPAFAALVPYVTGVVALDEDAGIRIVGPILLREGGDISGVSGDDVRIGQRVRVCFRRYADDVAMPCWVIEDARAMDHAQAGRH